VNIYAQLVMSASFGTSFTRALVAPVVVVGVDIWSIVWLLDISHADWLFNLFYVAVAGWLTFETLFQAVFRIQVTGDEIILKSVARTQRTTFADLKSIHWGKRWAPTTIRFRGTR
jgi:hypothetical protein